MKIPVALLALVTVPALSAPLSIDNDFLSAGYDPATDRFALSSKSGGGRIVDGAFGGGGGATVEPVQDSVFGAGRAITIRRADGTTRAIRLFPGLPFALIDGTIPNAGDAPLVTNRVDLFSAAVAGDGLVTLGTDGLRAPQKNPGSYAFLALADPRTRAGAVGGWLTHDRGSGVVFSSETNGQVRIVAVIEYGRLRVAPGGAAATEVFALGLFADARLGLESWADAIARHYRVQLPPQPAGYCTWYADQHGGACDEKNLPALNEAAARELKPFGFDFVLIDDGWQDGTKPNGPRKVFDRIRADGPYPSGMKAAADAMTALGLTPGIWFMPFAGTFDDPFFADKQDWFVHTADGKPYDTKWGGTCLDMTHPAARDRLRAIASRIAHEWGCRVFKMDGMWTGTATPLRYVQNGWKDDGIGDAVFHNPEKTNIEAYRDGIRLVREAAGPGVYLLGCCVSQNMRSFGGAFGLLDGMRIGPDTGSQEIGAPHGSRLYFLHGRVWHNDPDCVSVRASTRLDQARLNASWTALSGQLFYNSDWIPALPPERMDILKRTMPAHGLAARPVDLFETEPARVWLLSDTRREPHRHVLGLFNWETTPATIAVDLASAGLPAADAWAAFDFWGNAFLPPARRTLTLTLPPKSCRIVALRPLADRPQVLSTSRHITQGIVDGKEEAWDAATSTLRGRGAVVGGDAYELRIVGAAPGAVETWEVEKATVSEADAAAGVTIASRGANGLSRVTIASPDGREVAWSVRVRRTPRDASARPAAPANLRAEATWKDGVRLAWDAAADGVTFEVVRDGGAAALTAGPAFADAGATAGTDAVYAVTAVDWAGGRSGPATVRVAVPAPPKPGPVPPKPEVRLTSLKPVSAAVGWGSLQAGKAAGGGPLTVAGKTYGDGLGVHAKSEVVYDLKPEWKRFVAVAGPDGGKKDDPRTTVVFVVEAEVGGRREILARSPVLTHAKPAFWNFDVAIPKGAKRLRLIVDDGDDDNKADHADWCDAGFLR